MFGQILREDIKRVGHEHSIVGYIVFRGVVTIVDALSGKKSFSDD